MFKNAKQSIVNDEAGASSIFVLLTGIVLLLIASVCIVSVRSNSILNQTVYDWNKNYYELDSQGSLAVFKIEDALIKSENQALDYMYNKNYLAEEVDGLNYAIQDRIRYDWLAKSDKLEAEQIAFDSIYMYYANAYIEQLVNDIPQLEILKMTDRGIVQNMSVNIYLDGDNGEGLDISMDIYKPNYEIEIEDDITTYTRGNMNKIIITKWSARQELLK